MHPFWTKLNLKMHFLSAIQDAAAANRHHRAQQELTHKTTSFLKIYTQQVSQSLGSYSFHTIPTYCWISTRTAAILAGTVCSHTHRTFLWCEAKAPPQGQQVSWVSGTGWKAPGGSTELVQWDMHRKGWEWGKRPQTDPAQGQLGFWFVHMGGGSRVQLLPGTTEGAGSSQPVLDVKNGTWCQWQNPSK